MKDKFVPVWEDAVEEDKYLGIAELIKSENSGFVYGGKYFERWTIKFIGKNLPTESRIIDSNYVQFLFK